MDEFEDVLVAAEMAEVCQHAPAYFHPAIEGAFDPNHVTLTADGVECF